MEDEITSHKSPAAPHLVRLLESESGSGTRRNPDRGGLRKSAEFIANRLCTSATVGELAPSAECRMGKNYVILIFFPAFFLVRKKKRDEYLTARRKVSLMLSQAKICGRFRLAHAEVVKFFNIFIIM